MSLSASSLVQSVNKKIHGAKGKLGDDTQMYRILTEASRKLRGRVDLIGSKRIGTPIVIYKDVFEYPAPDDLQFHRVIELFDETDERIRLEPTDPSHFLDLRNPVPNDQGVQDLRTFQNPLGTKPQGQYAVEMVDGAPFMYIQSNYSGLAAPTMLNECDAIASNGTWAGSSDATNVRTDTQRYKTGSGSVAFDSLGGATTIVLTNSTMTAVDYSAMAGFGKGFLWVYIPSTTPSSITLKWGSDAANYYSVSVTTRQNGRSFIAGWNLISFDWQSATETGTVVDTAINYAELTITNAVATALKGYRIDALRFGIGREFTPKYYSTKIVRTEAGVRQTGFSAGGDATVLMEDEDDLLITEAQLIALRELREFTEAAAVEKTYLDPDEGDVARYAAKNPSQHEPRSFSYYHC